MSEDSRNRQDSMTVQSRLVATRAVAPTRVVSFTSGKGGVGKSNTVVNTAIALAELGKTVLILDADLSLANINVLLGIRPSFTINDVLTGNRLIEEIMIDGPAGISIIPAASGVEDLCHLSSEDQLRLLDAIESVAYTFDYLLIDTQAGIGPEVMYFNSASSEIVCLINEEPTSLTDAYALIKILSSRYGEKRISILVNEAANERSARGAFTRLSQAAERFLGVQLRPLGSIPADQAVSLAVHEQRAVLEQYPSSSAGSAFRAFARRLDQEVPTFELKGGMQFFFKQLLELSSHGN